MFSNIRYIKKITLVTALGFMMLVMSCVKEEASPITIDFSMQFVNDDMAPALVRFNNNTKGADTYQWTFEGGEPASSRLQNPGEVLFQNPGTFRVKLVAKNKDGVTEEKEMSIEIKPPLSVNFNTQIIDNNFPPVTVALTNLTQGANQFHWIFEGGNPPTSDLENPGQVIFDSPGDHIIRLTAGNGTTSFEHLDTINVAPQLQAMFDYDIPFINQNMQVPVQITMINQSVSATDYVWQFDGGTPATSTLPNPVVVYDTPGTYTISLQASNSKDTQTYTASITLYPDTNLVQVTDIQLGINTAHNTNHIGAFFATQTGLVYTDNDVNNTTGELIDLVYYGLNAGFGFNKFVSPDEVTDYALNPIPNAHHTKFINTLENCQCSANLSVAEFDNMTDDTVLSALDIVETPEGLQSFDNQTVPRIVLFETYDGRKGAIKIKDFVSLTANDSYIIVDIKYMKHL